MKASTHTIIRRLATILFAAAVAVAVVPAAHGFDGPPDAIDRYNAHQASFEQTLALGGSPDAIDRYQRANQPVVTSPPIQGSPDAIDRYRANEASLEQTLALGGSPDAVDRYVRANQPVLAPPDWIERYAARREDSTLALGGSPDAIDRYQKAKAPVLTSPAIQGPPDAMDRYAGGTVVVSAPGGSGFDWGDFGIGAAAMLGMVSILAGLGVGVHATRQRTDRVRIS